MKKDEKQYLEIFLSPVRKCKSYRPKFGLVMEKALLCKSSKRFTIQTPSTPGSVWIQNLMYAAHRAAGGMTSVYRQIGIGCERLFRAVLTDTTGYANAEFATWSYAAQTRSGKAKKLSLDGRLELSEIRNQRVLTNVEQWITNYCAELGEVSEPTNGIVFEVRQGYKSKDSKRQNADIDNATVAWANNYLPVFAVFSSQIDTDIVLRYRNNRCGILIGATSDNHNISLYAFCDQILGYDLAGFFRRHTTRIKKEIRDVLETLWSAA